jgi:hypothetical protein
MDRYTYDLDADMIYAWLYTHCPYFEWRVLNFDEAWGNSIFPVPDHAMNTIIIQVSIKIKGQFFGVQKTIHRSQYHDFIGGKEEFIKITAKQMMCEIADKMISRWL